jgi:hypothetical protein
MASNAIALRMDIFMGSRPLVVEVCLASGILHLSHALRAGPSYRQSTEKRTNCQRADAREFRRTGTPAFDETPDLR